MLEFVLNFAHGYFYFAITLIGVFAKKKLAVVHVDFLLRIYFYILNEIFVK